MKKNKCLIKLSKEYHYSIILTQLVKKDAPKYKVLPTDLSGKRNHALTFFNNYLKNISMKILKGKMKFSINFLSK